MQSVLTRLFQGLAWLVLAALVVHFYLAGVALFGTITFQPHHTLGNLLAVAVLLLLVVGLAAQRALLAGLTLVQILLPSLRTSLPVAALHVAVGIAAQTAAIAPALGRAMLDSRALDTPASVGCSTWR